MPVVRIPLVGQVTQRVDGVTFPLNGYDQVFQNAHFVMYQNQVTGKSTIYCAPQESFSATAAPAAGSNNGTAIKVWTGNANKIVTAFGATNSTIYMDSTSLGAITGIAGYISEMTISGVANLAIVSESNRGYFYDAVGATLTEITDTDFPSKQTPARTITGSFVHFDGFTGIMCTDGTFWHSDVNSITGWTSTAYLTAGDQPDPGIGALRYGSYIILFGTQSIEFWRNEGNAAGAVLSREVGSTVNVGCANKYGLTRFLDTVAWIGTRNGYGVYIMEGKTPKRISTDAIERTLQRAATTARLNVISSWSRPRLQLIYTGVDVQSHIYDPDTGIWSAMKSQSIRQTDTTPTGSSADACFTVGATADGFYHKNNEQGALSGGCVIQTAAMDFGTTTWKTMKRLTVIGDRQVPTNTDITVQFLDNDYVTPTTGRVITMSSTKVAPSLYRCGSFKKRSIVLSYQSTGGSLPRMEAVEIDYEVGAS